LDRVDRLRVEAFGKTKQKSYLGQFATPPVVATTMAKMFGQLGDSVRLLDAGAGVGSLSAAFVAEMCGRARRPTRITATGFEIDAHFVDYLQGSFGYCCQAAAEHGIAFDGRVIQEDFVIAGGEALRNILFGRDVFDAAILNPPYKKLASDSAQRLALRSVGIETSNLYTAFIALAVKLLEPGGELVAITPRSFCNGAYFRPFRELFLREMSIQAIHVFESRAEAFGDDGVLQENVIIHAVKTPRRPKAVVVTASYRPGEDVTTQHVPYEQFVNPADPERFIHIVTDEAGGHVSELMGGLPASLADLGLSVSTGPVVDFRSAQYLRANPERDTVPLVYPTHFADGWIAWPKRGAKKPNAIAVTKESGKWLLPSAVYVLVKRFSAKEEKRRVVAAVFDPARFACNSVGFENHVNYFHETGNGLSMPLAKGLASVLNSTVVDTYFRQFNGHTQVNATDLRNIRYPAKAKLEDLGRLIDLQFPDQDEIDRLVETELLGMAKDSAASNALKGQKRIDQAIGILKALGLPRAQQNVRSALTLLALLDLKPSTPWSKASAPRLGITPMMDYFAQHYGKKYAPNSRETVRRFSIHQFVEAGLAISNTDQPRAVNSPDYTYQISDGALELLRTYGSKDWQKALGTWLDANNTLRAKYAAERSMQQIPVSLPDGGKVMLSQEGQSILIKHILEDFCPRFTPGAEVLYVGDTGDKYAVFDEKRLKKTRHDG
jgi:adenine-specific DNA-methyltransferase